MIKNFKDAVRQLADVYIKMGELLNYFDGVSVREEVVEFIVEPKVVEAKKEEVIPTEEQNGSLLPTLQDMPGYTRITGEIENNGFITKTIEDLGLTTRSYNALRNNDIKYVEDLVLMTREKLLRLRGLGENSIFEISNALENHGLSLFQR